VTTSSISGVVVNFRTPELTASAARSILDEGVAEVLVVDNDSGDDSLAFLRSAFSHDDRLRVIANPSNVGFGSGVNHAAGLATSDLLFVLNSDATVRPGSLQALASVADDPAIGLVAPTVLDAQTGLPQSDAGGPFPTARSTLFRRNHRVVDPDQEWVSGVAFMIRRAVFEEVGGFDQAYFMYFEDVDLCWRLRRAGYRIERAPAAIVDHIGRASHQSNRRKHRQYFASQDRWFRKSGTPLLVRSAFRAARWPQRARRMLRP
jgi:N-acetylglucosaminyl-diphospho-decaprenol L-rhamnosyltransferase